MKYVRIIGISVSATLSGSVLSQVAYDLTDIGALTLNELTFLTGINDRGEVVGYSGFDPRTGFLWRDGQFIELVPGLPGVNPRDINNRGVVTGLIAREPQDRAFRWRQGEIEELDGYSSRAINDAGMSVGGRDDGGVRPVAYIGANVLALPTPEPNFGHAYDINEYGQICGVHTPDGVSRAALWLRGEFVDLMRPEFESGIARALNDRGEVVGEVTVQGQGHHVAIWSDQGAEVRTLPRPEGIHTSVVYDISNDGDVIVNDYTNRDPDVLLISDDEWLRIDQLVVNANGFDVQTAINMNAVGQIVGRGRAPSGEQHGYILTPVQLSLSEPIPGDAGVVNAIVVDGAEPDARIHFVYGEGVGASMSPGCPGATVMIASPRIAGSAMADPTGRAELEVFVPEAANGRTFRIQALHRETCNVSQVVTHTF